ncbi:MAG: segregation/condensation protein A [bacterium]|nr:segregation/condensation protein A [bacterium]
MSYLVQLEKFQGPLDVLLQLIEEQKLPISEISLATVTAQFLSYIKSLPTIDPNILADFLTVASKLLVIKSKTLLPALEEELEEDEASDLTQQLIQFKKYKEVAKYLKALEAKGRFSCPREASMVEQVAFYPDPRANMSRLHRAMQSLAVALEEITRLPKEIIKEVISISQKIKELQQQLGQKIEMKLSEALHKKSRTEIIVTFLAVLELVKQRILTVDQEELFAEILIKKRQNPTI